MDGQSRTWKAALPLFFVIGAVVATSAQEAAAPPKPAQTTKPWTVGRTPWGDPDLQGVWNIATSTPLERPERAGERETLSAEEAEEFARRSAFELTRDRRDGGAQADVRRAYSEHWMDGRRLTAADAGRTSIIVDPPNGRLPPLVPLSPERQQARKRRADAAARFNAGLPLDHEDVDADGRCVIRTDLPPYLPTIYNNNFQVFQSPGYVVIGPEMIHSARIIPMDGRPHLGKSLRQWLGDTRGRWDGATLVLETTNFGHEFDGRIVEGANPQAYRVTERITRVDVDTLIYEFTVDDPTTWTAPWSGTLSLVKVDPEEQIYEYACHEDNFDIVHFLSGARKLDNTAPKPPKQ